MGAGGAAEGLVERGPLYHGASGEGLVVAGSDQREA